jgi:beta-lactamase superfamily II metal-dependent hydrolase
VDLEEEMTLEIDMLAVGDANALIIRATDQYQEKVVVVDGGNSGDGEKVVRHIRMWTQRKTRVDLLLNTHADADHVDGLLTVAQELAIGEAWIHDPSAYMEVSTKSLIRQIGALSSIQVNEAAKSLSTANQLITQLKNKSVPLYQPFIGRRFALPDNALLTVLGPTEGYYKELLGRMALRAMKTFLKETKNTAFDALDEDNDRSASNNSSVIFTLEHRGLKYLFTADAGPAALENAQKDCPELMNDVFWLQVPHHGSRKSLTAELLISITPKLAYISAAGTNEHHPDRAVVEALRILNCPVYSTLNNGDLWYSWPVSDRAGYIPAAPLTANDLS